MASANGGDREAGMDVGTGSGRGSATGGEVGSATASVAPTPSVEGHGNDGNIDNVWNHATRIGTQGFICRYCSLTKKGGGATRLREQKYALRIVSQCVSSSGCERNWSTFALVHTKVRNRLGYEKLHKLVYIHYNLKLRIQQNKIEQDEKDLDPCAIMMDAALFDQSNPIMDWLNKSQSESCLILDEGGSLSRVILDEICRENSKRKLSHAGRKEKAKKGKMPMVDEEEEFMESDDDDEEDEFEDTSSKDDDDGHDDGSGGQEYEEIAKDREAHGHRPQRSKPVKKTKKDLSSLY